MKKIKEILKIFKIFNGSELIILISLFLITAILEVTGIFSIVPLISILFSEDKILENEYTQYIFFKFNFIDKDNYVIFLGIFVVLVNITTNLFNLLSQVTIHKLCWKNQYKINQMLFYNYFNGKFKNQTLSTAETFRQLSSDVDSLRTGIITTSLTIISKFLSILLIFLFISYLNIKVSFSIFITITLFYLIFYKSISSIIKKNAQILLSRTTEKIRVMQDMLGSYKQLKVMNLYQNYINHYHYQFNEVKKVDIKNTILSILPRYLLEPIFVLIFIALFILSKLGNELLNIGFYAAILYSFFRMAPAFQAIYHNYGSIKKYYPIYQNILSKLNFDILNEKNNSNLNFNDFKTLSIKNLTFSYDENKKIFLNQNITFRIGESYFVEGENGSGKTTLVDILMKIIQLEKGNILIDDINLNDEDEKNYQSLFSYTPQKNHIFETTLEKNISLETENKFIDFDKIKKLMKYFKFEDFLNTSDEIKYKGLIATSGKNISGGQAQKIGILRSFYFNKKILIFDESTNQIDTNTEKEIVKNILMKKNNKLIIFISHNLNLKKYFDNIVSIKQGIIKINSEK